MEKFGDFNKPVENKKEDLVQKKFLETGLSNELFPYWQQMEDWIKIHKGDVDGFLDTKNTGYKIVCGDGFYHAPADNKICLSVPFFKDMIETGKYDIDHIFFGTLHEFAHLKAMFELDNAGLKNEMAQFGYMRQKTIRDKEGKDKYLGLYSSYQYFYNILEDAIVNSMVFDTRHFGESVDSESRDRHNKIVSLYTDNFFQIYTKVADGNGDHIKNLDKKSEDDPEYIFVGDGKGDFKLNKKEDYNAGFNWNDTDPKINKGSQLLTFFLKSQMEVIDSKNVFEAQLNPNGKNILDEDVAYVLNAPLYKSYKYLLSKIKEKYKNNPEKWSKYKEFMEQGYAVPSYKNINGKIVESEPGFFYNVARDIDFAELNFDSKIQNALLKLGENKLRSSVIGFSELFNKFKKTKKVDKYSNSLNLILNLEKRTEIFREVFEPIFTMLCILDESFEVNAPEKQSRNNPPGEPKPPKSPEEQKEQPPETWKAGDIVDINDRTNPYFGKRGIIRKITQNHDGQKAVEVELYEEAVNKMADKVKPDYVLSGQSTIVLNPNNINNKLYLVPDNEDDEDGEGESQNPNDDRPMRPREKKEKKDEDKKDSKDKQKEKQEKSDSQENNSEEKKDNNGNSEGDSKEEKLQESDAETAEKTLKELSEMAAEKQEKSKEEIDIENILKERERQERLRELEREMESQEYKDKQRVIKEKEDLEKIKKSIEGDNNKKLENQDVVQMYQDLKKKIEPYSRRMAENWLAIIRNISHKINIIKDKYYNSGNIDWKRAQRLFPKIEEGEELDFELIHTQLIEKIQKDLRPNMLRLSLLIDESGSMQGDNMNAVYMALMLLKSSLGDFKLLFRDEMKRQLDQSFDVMIDTEFYFFGDSVRKIKGFDYKDLSFLEDDSKERPVISDPDKDTKDMLRVFGVKPEYSGTGVRNEYNALSISEKEIELLKNGKITQVCIEISDGETNHPENKILSSRSVSELNRNGVSTIGFAIGNDAKINLKNKGIDNVVTANSVEEIVEEFGRALEIAIKNGIEKPMEDYLDSYTKN